MRIESMSQFQMRLLKRLSNVINMFGASLHCLTRTEMPWWAMDQMWTGGNTIERDLCKKTKQPKHMAMSYQPLLTGSWFLAALAAPYLPFLLTDSWFRIQSHPDSQCLTEMRPGLDRQDVMRRRRKRWRRRRSTSWGTYGPLTLKMFLPHRQWQWWWSFDLWASLGEMVIMSEKVNSFIWSRVSHCIIHHHWICIALKILTARKSP